MAHGLFFGYEGIDGSGKGTQHTKSKEALTAGGVDVVEFDFPQYGSPSGAIVAQYLNGEFGRELSPRVASTFFASDRLAAAPKINEAIGAGSIVQTNRFTMSNAAHQGQKIDDPSKRRDYYDWLFHLEHDLMGIPRPNAYILFRISPKLGQLNVDKKGRRAYTRDRDIHEADIDHLRKAADTYDELADLYSEQFSIIDCMDGNGVMRPEEDIHKDVMKLIGGLILNKGVLQNGN